MGEKEVVIYDGQEKGCCTCCMCYICCMCCICCCICCMLYICCCICVIYVVVYVVVYVVHTQSSSNTEQSRSFSNFLCPNLSIETQNR